LVQATSYCNTPGIPRFFFRARYAERIGGTEGAWSRLLG
jgi:hypothetical protein